MEYVLLYFMQVTPATNLYTIETADMYMTQTECLKQAEEFNSLPKETDAFLFATCMPLTKYVQTKLKKKSFPME